MTFFELLRENILLIIFLILSPYIFYYIFAIGKILKAKKKKSNELKKIYSYEEEKLGIVLEKSDPAKYKHRMDDLIELLRSTNNKISVSAIEAIMLVEMFSDSVALDENGTLVIQKNIAMKFANEIYNDPMKFITYIKSIESKIDLKNKENKIDLEDVLFMMRNAKKFGLKIDSEDTDSIFNIKAAICKNQYQNVVIEIINDEVEEDEENYILENTYDEDKVKQSMKQEVDKRVQEDKNKLNKLAQSNDTILSVERLDNGHLVITTKDGTKIEKDDLVIHSIELPSKENNNANSQVVKLNQTVASALSTSNNNSTFSTSQTSTPSDTIIVNNDKKDIEKQIVNYIEEFGQLDHIENQYKNELKFKERARKIFSEDLFNSQKFLPRDFAKKSFFKNKEVLKIFFNSLFQINNAISGAVTHIEQDYLYKMDL